MKAKKLIVAGLVGLVAAALVVTGLPAQAKKAAGPVVVGTDPVGDWGAAVDPTLGPLGDPLGQDLVSASIAMKDAKTINFVIGLNSLPPSGGVPEVSRYTWDFTVNGKFAELDGKFTNFSRGACDPTSGQCPPPRNPGLQPFIVRNNCHTDNTLPVAVTACDEVALVQAVFDAAAKTITVSVPADAIAAKPGSKIAPSANIFGGTISAAPSAFLTSGNSPMDTLTAITTFVVPK